MKTKEFDYFLPKELIAQKPIQPRDHSRLMVLDRAKGTISHDFFFNLGKYLKRGDCLILNDTRVIPARLIGYKLTGGRVEILIIKASKKNCWQVLVKGTKIKKNLEIKFGLKLIGKLVKKLPDNIWEIRFNFSGKKLKKIIARIGLAPTPPYIKRISNLKEYQTIYAKKGGSIAAPTAGFHFTKNLIKSLKRKGVKFKFITLHIGLGTFQPLKKEKIEEHKMAAEYVIINKKTAKEINKIKREKRRIVTVGTSTVRALESAVKNRKICPFKGWTTLYIKPDYKFKFVEALITNFHLPKSTNLILVSALAGKKFIFKAYQEAIKKRYRFYSFGDAMLII